MEDEHPNAEMLLKWTLCCRKGALVGPKLKAEGLGNGADSVNGERRSNNRFQSCRFDICF